MINNIYKSKKYPSRHMDSKIEREDKLVALGMMQAHLIGHLLDTLAKNGISLTEGTQKLVVKSFHGLESTGLKEMLDAEKKNG